MLCIDLLACYWILNNFLLQVDHWKTRWANSLTMWVRCTGLEKCRQHKNYLAEIKDKKPYCRFPKVQGAAAQIISGRQHYNHTTVWQIINYILILVLMYLIVCYNSHCYVLESVWNLTLQNLIYYGFYENLCFENNPWYGMSALTLWYAHMISPYSSLSTVLSHACAYQANLSCPFYIYPYN